MLFGAAIGNIVANPFLAMFLALFSHYFLDFFPHEDYSINNMRNKEWAKVLPDALKVAVDIVLGLLLVYLFSRSRTIIYLCGLIALLPDALTLVSSIFYHPILEKHQYIHTQKVHFLKYKKIPLPVRIFTQIFFVVVSLSLLLYY